MKRVLLAILSALLTIIALFHLLPWLAAVALVPLLYVLRDTSLRDTLKFSVVFAVSFGLCFFSWIPASAGLFNGAWWSGVLVYVIFTLALSIYFLLLFGSYNYLGKDGSPVRRALLLGAIVVLIDYLKDTILATMPWFDFHFGNALAGNTFTIQLAEWGGVYVLSFVAVFVNVLIVEAIAGKLKLKWVIMPIILFLIVNVGLYSYRSNQHDGQEIKINLLTENIDPRVKWEQDGNRIVGELLRLSEMAGQRLAAINVWTETVVPWTYIANDDFIQAVLQRSKQVGALTLLGINTPFNENEVFDSAYLLSPNGAVMGRYDKNFPLAAIESSFAGGLFANTRGVGVARGGAAEAIVSPIGKLGVYICNEASLPQVAGSQAASGADFLINISNDGWFANSFIPRQHFYYNRLRAVETRRYVVANSNMGFKGAIAANGDMDIHGPSKGVTLTQVSVFKQGASTLYQLFPWAMLLISIFIITYFNFKKQ